MKTFSPCSLSCLLGCLLLLLCSRLHGQILIDKCLVSSATSYPSGSQFAYRISFSIGAGLTDLTIEDRLPAHLGTSAGLVSPAAMPGASINTSLIGGTSLTRCGTTAVFGTTVRVRFSSSTGLPAGTYNLFVTVQTKYGDMYKCTVLNEARAYSQNIRCTTSFSPPKSFYSNRVCVDITASNCWSVDKTFFSYVGTNVIRWRVAVNCSGQVGCHNLYNVVLNDFSTPGSIILNASGGLVAGAPVVNAQSNWDLPLQNLDVCAFWPQFIFVDVEYPCDASQTGTAFPPGTSVNNCAILRGEGPADCNASPTVINYGGCRVASHTGLCPGTGCSGCTATGLNQVTCNFPNSGKPLVSISSPCPSALIPASYNATGYFGKVQLPGNININNAPCCKGRFHIFLVNNGSIPLTNISLTDDWPDFDLNLLNVSMPAGFTADYAGSSGGCPQSGLPSGAPGCQNPTFITFHPPLGYTVYPGQSLDIFLDYEIPCSAPTGSSIQNQATVNFQGTLLATPLCDPLPPFPITGFVANCNFSVEHPEPVPGMCKNVVSGGGNYLPGQLVEYEICISNYGGAPLDGTLTDILPPNFTFASFSSADVFCSDCTGPPCGKFTCGNANCGNWCNCSVSGPCSSLPGFSATQTSSNPPTWDISIPAQCTKLCNATLCLRYKALIGSTVPPGSMNAASLATDPVAPNYAGETICEEACVNVVQLSAASLSKLVKGNMDAGFSSSGTCSPGGSADFKLVLQNTGNVSIEHVVMSDLLPEQGKKCITNAGNASAFSVTINSISAANISTSTLLVPLVTHYPGTASPVLGMVKPDCIPPPFPPCPGCPAPGPGNVVRLDFGTAVLAPGEIIEVVISTSVPSGAAIGAIACNCASMGACTQLDNTALQYTSTGLACVTVKPFVPDCCGKNVATDAQPSGIPTLAAIGTHNVLHQDFDLTCSPYPVQEMRVSIVDLNLSFVPDKACVKCYTPYPFLGTFNLSSVQPSLASLAWIPTLNIDRELVYAGTPSSFSSPQTLGLDIRLPDLENIPCCTVSGEMCLKFTFKDAECNYCEVVRCIPVSY